MRVLILATILFYYSCESNKDIITGTWAVEEFRLDGKDLSIYDVFIVNLFSIYDDEKGQIIEFPLRNIGDNSKEFFFQSGIWSYSKQDDKEYLTFSGSLDDVFNSKFEMELSSRKQGQGFIVVLELISERVYMKSAKIQGPL